MKKKTKEKLKSKLYPIMQSASFGQIPERVIEQLWNWYIKFLEVFFMITTSLTITLTFSYFIPVFLHKSYDLSITIILCLILIQLRFGTMTIQYKEED